MLTNWRTTLVGVAGVLSSVVGILQHLSDGSPIDINQHVTEIMLACGLLVAKDHNK